MAEVQELNQKKHYMVKEEGETSSLGHVHSNITVIICLTETCFFQGGSD